VLFFPKKPEQYWRLVYINEMSSTTQVFFEENNGSLSSIHPAEESVKRPLVL
jgi:hypothetical protein